MVKEGTLERWMAIEMGRMRDAMVTQPRSLSDLLLDESPAATTRGGDPHPFERAMLQRFADALSPLARRKLRLPATFYVESEMPNEAYLTDETAMTLLRALGEVPAALDARAGRLWIAHARARDIAERYPRAFQFSWL